MDLYKWYMLRDTWIFSLYISVQNVNIKLKQFIEHMQAYMHN